MTSQPIDIAAVKRSANIAHIIGQFVSLKKDGHEYVGLCPFHHEKTGSFKVDPVKSGGVYICFGCQASGDVIRFMQHYEQLDFRSAVRRVAELSGNPVPEPEPITFRRGEPRPAAAKILDAPSDDIGPIVATYDYTDERDRPLFHVHRHEPGESFTDEEGNIQRRRKTFRQTAADGTRKTKGIRRVLYHLSRVIQADSVWLVEGEKDVHTLERLGFTATTWSGGASAPWQAEYTESLAGKIVYLCADNDAPGRARGDLIERELQNRARVVRIALPEAAKDVSDFIEIGNSAEDLRAIADEALAAAPELIIQQENPYAPAEAGEKLRPNDIARLIIRDHIIMSTEQGFVYEYNHRVWERTTPKRIAAYAMAYDTHDETKLARRREAADYVITRQYTPRVQWRQISVHEIPVWNGVFDLRTGKLRSHRQEDFLEAVPATPYFEDRECPTWLAALEMYWSEDPDYLAKIAALQEFFGYVLMSHARYKKALLLYGESDTGKSQIATVLRMLVGDSNTCCISVEAMDDPRRLTPIMGKMINLLTEVTSKAVVADGGFKTLVSGEEAININPKYQDEITYIPTAKHIIVCNTLPGVTDHSRGTFNRLLLLKFNRVIPKDQQDKNLSDKLRREAEGILVWSLEGAKRLNAQRGEFTKIAESEAEIADYRDTENPVNAFVAECCEPVEDEYETLLSEVAARFSDWSGKRHDIRYVSRLLKSAGFRVEKSLKRGPSREKRVVIGLRLTTGE